MWPTGVVLYHAARSSPSWHHWCFPLFIPLRRLYLEPLAVNLSVHDPKSTLASRSIYEASKLVRSY